MRSLSVPNGQEPVPASTRTRPMFGVFYEHQFMPYLALRSGIDYTQRGFSTTDGQGAGATLNDYAVNYIEKKVDNPLGTGGTPYIPWLKQLIEETREFLLA